MKTQVFNKMPFSLIYHKHMVPIATEITSMVLSYVKEKTGGRPLEMALDVGCGTGRSTLPLAPHFKKVLGIDISDSQINVAKQYNTANNVSYMVAPAERLPVQDNSVDLVNTGLAAQLFTIENFFNESVRVLKTNGCLAAHGFFPFPEIEYKDLSHDLNTAMSEMWDTLCQQAYTTGLSEAADHMLNQYRTIYETIDLKDKKWIKDIPVKYQMSISEIFGFARSLCTCQILLEKNEKEAKQLLAQTDKRMRDILGEEADSARLNFYIKHYCVLACKH
ncbi:putative methyltransferase DDB_G0268948 isoform X2 [Engystomops pustulosus]